MVSQIPPALRTILPVLAADQGRARARTLLLIVGVGPDLVDQRVAELDAALGGSSPGRAGLTGLADAARAAASADSPKVARQHVISKAILRRFCEPGAGNAGPQLMRHDVLHGACSAKGSGGVGYVRDFVKLDSKATEELWQQVENHLPRAIDAAIDQSILGDPALILVLRNAIALQHVRNPQALEVHEQTFDDAFRQAIDTLAATPAAAEAFRRRYRLTGSVRAGRRPVQVGSMRGDQLVK